MVLLTDKGAALITVVILIFILIILSSVMLSFLSNQTRLISHDISRIKAKYAEEAVLVREFAVLRNASTIESSHNVPGRYDDGSQSWIVGISSGPSSYTNVNELNFTVDYYTPF